MWVVEAVLVLQGRWCQLSMRCSWSRCGSSLSGVTVVVTMAAVHSIRLLPVYTRVGTVRVLEVLDTLYSLGSLSEEGEENQLVVTVMLLVVELDTPDLKQWCRAKMSLSEHSYLNM